MGYFEERQKREKSTIYNNRFGATAKIAELSFARKGS
jgi:hypothetical protein